MRSEEELKAYSYIYQPELLLVGWMSASFVLMTTSLLFYHMVKVSSIEMTPHVAALFAVSLIVISLMLSTSALYSYAKRTRDLVNESPVKGGYQDDENTFRGLYVFIIITVAIIQLGISTTIFQGIYKNSK